MLLKRWAVLTAFAASALIGIGAQAKESASTGQVKCKDGTFSSAKGKGACSGHGGVLKASAADEAKSTASKSAADAKSKASSAADEAKSTDNTVLCKDGTRSKAESGACSHHGGVATTQPAQSGLPPPSSARTGESGTGGGTTIDPGAPPTSEPVGNSPAPAPSTKSASQSPTPGTPDAKGQGGTFSYAKEHEGACSHHGGVAQWLDTK